MALKKSELYSSLWASCDELRGGMDASQYKDYVLVLLFIKYISDKYAGQKRAAIKIPDGASFADMIKLKGKSDIGDQINKKIIAPLAKENKLSDMPDFDDATKLGTGKEKVDRLTNLIAIFENPALDFSKNRADGDDILGDAYEYLMRHFATESGKSKGQFYTPAEVSRIMAQILGVEKDKVAADTTVYDPTCGSGSLLLKVSDEAQVKPSLYGQEKDSATSGLARMNMILHDNPTALINQGNTIADPKFKDGNNLKQFDYVVANPPFSDKRWSTGIEPANDPYERFKTFGAPPAKQGDYAYLLHIVRSLKSTGKGACILPHGVLFRGNAEADIRKNLITKNGCYIKGIIGLPPNLFYGTGIAACIVAIDKKEASTRKGIFMIDASQGFIKDGPKNRLREQDIHKIVDVFNNQTELPRFSRMIPLEEIQKNEYNLNIPRYIDSQFVEDRQDIAGHLQGGIPKADIEDLSKFWEIFPNLKNSLFKEARQGYFNLTVEKSKIKAMIFGQEEFKSFIASMNGHFEAWKVKTAKALKKMEPGFHPKVEIKKLSEDLLYHYKGKALIDAYDIYQHLMNYWSATMSDDFYLISADGWKASTYRIIEKDKKGKEKDKGWTCDLIPKDLVVAKYFAKEQAELAKVTADLESIASQIAEMEGEHGGDEGAFSELEKVNKASAASKLKEIAQDKDAQDEASILKQYIDLCEHESELKRRSKELETSIDSNALRQYSKLKEADVKELIVDDKWMATLGREISGELDRMSRLLAARTNELADRYAKPLSEIKQLSDRFEREVDKNLEAVLRLIDKSTRLSGYSKSWTTKPLGELFQFSGGFSASREQLSAEGYPYLHYGDIHTSKRSYLDLPNEMLAIPKLNIALTEISPASLLKHGDIVFVDASEDDEGASKHVVIYNPGNSPFISGLHTIVARPRTKELHIDYLRFCFQSEEIKKQFKFYAVGTKVLGVSKTNIAKINLTFPDLDEQKAISKCLIDLESQLEQMTVKASKTTQLRKGMMQELLTGRIRL